MNDDVFKFDFAIAGTGYFVDPTQRPELADFRTENLRVLPVFGKGALA